MEVSLSPPSRADKIPALQYASLGLWARSSLRFSRKEKRSSKLARLEPNNNRVVDNLSRRCGKAELRIVVEVLGKAYGVRSDASLKDASC